MKVYNRIVLHIDTWQILEEDSFEYTGPVDLAKGGGGGGDTVDKEYNRRMASIAESQQSMAQEYFDFWRSDQQPLEAEQIKAERGLLPERTALTGEQIASERRMLGVDENYQREMLNYATDDLKARKPLAQKYYNEAMKGDDVNRVGMQAKAGVAQEYDIAAGAQRREAARAGADVNSARFRAGMNSTSLSRARDIAGQSTLARQKARDANFGKLDAAMNKPLGVGA